MNKLLDQAADYMYDHFIASVAIIVLIVWGLMSLAARVILS